jgi:MFS superfamily sulfate permease-like transporter
LILISIGLKLEHSGEKHSTFETACKTFSSFGKSFNVNAAILGCCCLLFLMTFKFIKHKVGHKHPWVSQIPEILLLVLLTTVLSVVMDFERMKIPTLGIFDNKLPPFSIPSISSYNQITRLMPNIGKNNAKLDH